MFGQDLFSFPEKGVTLPVFIVFLAWSFVWKGLALWNSAKSGQKYWFIALLIVNTVGLLEIFYLLKYHKAKLLSYKNKLLKPAAKVLRK
ncbi:MAG: hypothetical protein US60_C0007G0013 [Microgenomates group bacterium GW2011_GWC1_37_8]|uniref:DUF5652 domain-containing protein n=2 Tax=Candidatus Woeseibacteriota TaxID=1752722 RepID=A0A0G0P7J6_9BACT|nr:MAG: hypothetical protein US60_C0007G0013 [Microgenomates group bacterium GW2011_GWC1_37_8]KKQ85276.1 MAG: hypothetical protein UT08_C0008G0032 [Candidatus Woesebacteria bacterium GW2011_GWB1_38_8]OGM20065.1 MAG: hypothetical protein A2863_01955 [Candidatus Woesebacteria bacterium RIFCSPHIGHO2_01_FULL_38_9b]